MMSPFPFTLSVRLLPCLSGIRSLWRRPAVWQMAVLVLALAVFANPAMAAKRVALVIGNDDYRSVPKLLKAVNDARTMAATLRQIGFTVTVAENQTRRQFSEALLAFDSALEPGDIAFFFYSGHGYEITGQNFLLPVDVPAATEGQEDLVRDAAFSADRIVERLLNRNVRSAILVFDACRNNPFEREGVRALPGSGGLAPMNQIPNGVFSVFSAGPRQTALDRLSDDDVNPNSVFTRIFAKELLQPGLSLVQVAQSTRRSVSEIADQVGHKQVPAYFDQMVDDVFLTGKATADAKTGDQPANPAPANTNPTVVALAPPVGSANPAPPVNSAPPPVAPPPVATAPAPVAPQNVAVLPPVSPPALPGQGAVNAPMATFFRHNTGWSVTLSIADPALAVSWRVGNSGEFQETRLLNQFDPRTRKRTPSMSFELPLGTPAGTIEVRYVDINGSMQGPFSINFDPLDMVTQTQRERLEDDNSDWVRFGEWSELTLDYSRLIEANCVIAEIFLDIDSMGTRKIIQTPPCQAGLSGSGRGRSSLKLPSMTRFVSVQLLYRDGTRSAVRTFRR